MSDAPRSAPSGAPHRAALLATVAALWLAALVVKGVVRPAFASHAGDGARLLVEVAPSLVGGLTVPLCFLAVHPRPQAIDVARACAWSLLILGCAELLERALPRSTFDWRDLAASVLGVAIAGTVAWAFLPRAAPRTASP